MAPCGKNGESARDAFLATGTSTFVYEFELPENTKRGRKRPFMDFRELK
jgi:hypothetical protein